MPSHSSKSVLYTPLTDELTTDKYIDKQKATQVFNFFSQCPLFRWRDANNDCEDRANAICILLDHWNIPNYKGWVFSGYFLNRESGSLINSWNYHVAALLPVLENQQVVYYIIDPATSIQLLTIEDWATSITDMPFSYHFIRNSAYYIFPVKVKKDPWFKRNKRNYRWTMQGLSGINGVSSIGKVQLTFMKKRVKNAERAFNKLKCNKPLFDNY
jgi:hypothetical protein